MKQFLLGYRWWLVGVGVLVASTWGLARLTAPWPDSVEDIASRIRVGMSQQEAVALLCSCRDSDLLSSVEVVAKGSRTRSLTWYFHELPPATAVEWAKLNVADVEGVEVEVTLGPGGLVTGKRLNHSETSLSFWRSRGQRALHRLRPVEVWSRQARRAAGL